MRARSLQKNRKTRGGIFRCIVVLLVTASVALSIFTVFVSWVAIQKDEQRLENSKGLRDRPHFESRPIGRSDKIEEGNRDTREIEAKEVEVEPHQQLEKENDEEPLQAARQNKALPVSKALVSGTSNSQVYQPSATGRRILTYRRFGGRLNNQLFQFITALQHAKVLKRTFVVPNEVRDVDWTGMFDEGFGIWDMSSLNNAYDIDWKTGLSADFVTKQIPKDCVLTPREGKDLLNGGPKLWKAWDEKCPDVIDLAGDTGLLFCEQQHQFCGDNEAQMEAYFIYKHIKLTPELLKHIPSKRDEFRNKGYDELAIHSRRAGEGGFDWELCVNGNYRTCKGHVDTKDRHKFCDMRTIKGNCAIWLDLDYQIKSKSALKAKQTQYKFILASDGTHDWSIDFKGQFLIADNTEWLMALEDKVHNDPNPDELIESMAVSAIAHSVLRGQKDLTKIKGRLTGLTATLLELFSLVDSKYLLGAYYSTLSLNACLFRGMDRIYDSNMCWMLMHPNSKYAIPPPESDSANVNADPKADDPNNLPAALMSDVEHAFVRSEDKQFIAIDRYLIHFKGKQVIGVLGDGLVPMTILNDPKEGERVQADFTCSYGNQHSPATIIPMKGHQPFEQHYYTNGEKYNTPFSTNGDRFRTMIIMCEKLRYDRSLSRHPALILKSPDGKFELSIGSTFQRPVGKVLNAKSDRGKKEEKTLVHCLNPVYGLKDPRWLIEYLQYEKAIGVSHVHIYNINLHSPEMQAVLQAFRDEEFITRHDWSEKASGEYTTRITYEHAKWAAQTDCALRSRGIYDYALFSDIDEVVVGGQEGHLTSAMETCDEAKKKRSKVACSFNSNTVSSIYTKLSSEEEEMLKHKLILERYTAIEAEPHCPANCKCLSNDCSTMTRKYHNGRQKYMANVKDLAISPRPMWTHALARDYDEMDKIMEVLPDDVMHVRHYQGHWYKNKDLLNTMEEKESPLPNALIEEVATGIANSKDKRKMHTKRLVYDKAKESATSNGVEWIETIERPPLYHS